ncbi:MAG: hypothetical protein OEW05_04770 [Candidatus Aminicenantes bacterium]|nr:hypothetical protein [Candidatus Aminicenantes bacterium]
MKGFHTRVEFKGATFLVQSQDTGAPGQYVESLIYASGKLLTSRRTFYRTFLNNPNLRQLIQQLLEEQHKAIIEEIKQGKFARFLETVEKD